MVGFLDIAPSTKTVPFNGADVDVPGVSLFDAVALLRVFPKFMSILVGGGGMTVESIMAQGPDLIAAVIAAGTGSGTSKKARDKALALPLQAQFDFVEAIIDVTMPDGPGPFVKRLTGLLNSMAAGSRAQSAPADQDGPSIGTAPGITLRQPSKDSSPADTLPLTSGE
jgi:hypothetical protein